MKHVLPAWARVVLAVGVVFCMAEPVVAQLLPQTGGGPDVTVRPGLPPALPPAADVPAWRFAPALDVQQEWTDDAVSNSARKQSSFITVVTPSLGVTVDSVRLSGTLAYAPNLYHYEPLSRQDRVSQNLDFTSHATLLQDLMFLDLRGFATEQALYAGTAPAGATTLDRQNQVQTYSFAATPYVTERFGGWGTAQLGVSLSQTTQSTLGAPLPGSTSDSQIFRSVQESASFTSGEDFGRILSNVQVQAAQEAGNGVLAGAYRDSASYQAGYAFTHTIVGLASIGWETINYGRADPLHIDDLTWNVGFKLTPNPDSVLTLLYGHQDGVTAASLDASYAPSARTRLFARYSEGITTEIEQLQSSLATAQLDPLGNPVDSVTGAPLQLTNNFFGTTNTIFRTRSYSLTGAWQLSRDSFQATVNRQEQTPVGALADATQRNTGSYGSLAWQHDWNGNLKSRLFGEYGIQDFGGGGTKTSSPVVVLSTAATYAFSGTLTGSAQYSYASNAYAGTTSVRAVNLVALGLHKTF